MSALDAGLKVGRMALLRETVVAKKQFACLIEKATGMIGDDLAGQAIRGNASAITKLVNIGEKATATQGENALLKQQVYTLSGKVEKLAAKHVTAVAVSGQTGSIKAVLPKLQKDVRSVSEAYGYTGVKFHEMGHDKFWTEGFHTMAKTAKTNLNTIETLVAKQVTTATKAGHVLSPEMTAVQRLLPSLKNDVDAAESLFSFKGNHSEDTFNVMRRTAYSAIATLKALLG